MKNLSRTILVTALSATLSGLCACSMFSFDSDTDTASSTLVNSSDSRSHTLTFDFSTQPAIFFDTTATATTQQWDTIAHAADTRTILSVASSGVTLDATWKVGDQAYLVTNTNKTATFTAESTAKTSRFKGDVQASNGENFYVFYPKPNGTTVKNTSNNQELTLNIATQDGTLEGIANKLDFTRAVGTITAVSGSNISQGNITNQQNHAVVVQLRFKEPTGQDITDITDLTITGAYTEATLNLQTGALTTQGTAETITINNLGNGNGVRDIYVALLPGTAKLVFKATRKSNKFTNGGYFASANFSTAGRYIRACTCLYSYIKEGPRKWATGNLIFDVDHFYVADKQYYMIQDWENPVNANDLNAGRRAQRDRTDLFYFSIITNEEGKYDMFSNQNLYNMILSDLQGLWFIYQYSPMGRNGNSLNWGMDEWPLNDETEYRSIRWGDLAYWATRGSYITPTGDELDKLKNYPYHFCYVEGEGKRVYGMLYNISGNPRYGTSSTWLPDNPVAYTLDDVQNSDVLFLPATGTRNVTQIKDGSYTRPSDRWSVIYHSATAKQTNMHYWVWYADYKYEPYLNAELKTCGTAIRPLLNLPFD